LTQNADEIHSYAIMIYSHFVFLLLRLLTYCLTSSRSQSALTRCRSLLYSGDTIATIVIFSCQRFLAMANAEALSIHSHLPISGFQV